ncbi:MAG: RNA polymerase sigma factor [Patescibacteria group bacterium]|nr:RNA polymerase sigma factor [Patescibacteria group bacterium]
MEKKSKEKKLVERIIKKDKRAIFLFYNQHKKLVFNFIYQRTKDYYLSEELTQDVFFDFLEGLRDFRFQSSLKTFLLAIAKNKTIDYFRKKKIKKILFSCLPVHLVEGLKKVFLEEEIEKKELAFKIKKVFEKLPDDYQKILRLKYIDGEQVKQIAEKFKLGFKATESLLFRARKAFIKVFNQQR